MFLICVAVAGCGGQKQAAPPAATMDMKGGVRLTADEIRQFGVTFDTVRVRPLAMHVRTTGTVVNDETTLAQVALKIGGYVERLYVDQTGQRVQRGQPLVSVYSPDVVAAQDELLVAARLDSTAGSASSLVDAGKRRLRAWGVGDDQIERVLRTGKVEHAVTLTAPVSGVVIEKKVVQGQAIQAGDMLLSVADLSDVWINADVREMDASDVHVGSRATIELPSYPGRAFGGRVSFVYPTVQGDARAVTARIVVANPEGLLKPGMYATVGLITPTVRALTVPSSALLHTGARTLAFVAMDDGSFMPHDVTLGRTAGELTEVLSGLEPGQRVVTSAQYLLDSESNLAEVMKSMIGQSGRMDTMRDMPGMQMAPPRRDSTQRR
jgi:multidrug efflux pump subunit AcrA (membrane-fusion protein)